MLVLRCLPWLVRGLWQRKSMVAKWTSQHSSAAVSIFKWKHSYRLMETFNCQYKSKQGYLKFEKLSTAGANVIKYLFLFDWVSANIKMSKLNTLMRLHAFLTCPQALCKCPIEDSSVVKILGSQETVNVKCCPGNHAAGKLYSIQCFQLYGVKVAWLCCLH